ncbi:MAG TPA: DUF1501 domain-containing protein [Mycobacteriales bacterium]|nr:DUF1501 domain-containing protein [Mycobacteriales bacterium]
MDVSTVPHVATLPEDQEIVDGCSCGTEPGALAGDLTRRRLLTGLGAMGALAVGEAAAPRLAFAAGAPAKSDLIVSVFLRGAMDGLSAVVPYADPEYYAARPGIRILAKAVHRLDASFGLHPVLKPMLNSWHRGDLAVVHAVGSPHPTRSHFDAQDFMERGVPGDTTVSTGWLGRHLASRPSRSSLRAIAVGGNVQLSLRGPVPAIALKRISDFSLVAEDAERTVLETTLERLYSGLAHQMGGAGVSTVGAARRLRALARTTYHPAGGAKYPTSELGRQLAEVARLAKARVGLEAACVDANGWDTHEAMGTHSSGRMTVLLADLGQALGAFYTDLAGLRGVTVVVMSEFGRRVAENGSGGTDHGHGGVMFVMGAGIRGHRVYGRWPGLAPHRLDRGDLAVTTDYRDVLGEVLMARGGGTSMASVFPRHAVRPLGLADPR